ncbi:MAG: metal ABC transporter ATP-binding protein [Spirochaetes bacterium]|nr:metal ABC transporter ATP-binding protein [Spirochaetota bacterium]
MIEINNLNYSVNNKIILQNITLQIEKGQFVSVIGPNGAGKSTLLKCILGLIKETAKSIYIEGIPLMQWHKKNIIGYVPQKEQFDHNFPATTMEIILMGLVGKKPLLSFFNKKDKMVALDIMKQLKIDHLKDELIGNLSGGEYQRVLLGRALITGSDYIFLDEPDANVDNSGKAKFYELLQDLNQEGKTVFLISHDINTVIKFSTSLVCLNKTLHCHDHPELLEADVIKKTYGEVIRIIERK